MRKEKRVKVVITCKPAIPLSELKQHIESLYKKLDLETEIMLEIKIDPGLDRSCKIILERE